MARARSKKKKGSLEDVRKQIDAIDAAVVDLLDRRAGLAIRTASLKRARGDELYQPSREAKVMRRVLDRRRVFPESSLAAIYREIMGASLGLERDVRLAILGPVATYTHVAAIKHFGRSCRIAFEASIPDVFLRVEKEDAEIGIVPVENSTEGAIVHTLDTLVESRLLIAGEILLPVRHNLLVHPSAMKGLKDGDRAPLKIVSHPQALAQCRNSLEAYFAGVPVEAAPSTAAAAREASKRPGVCAVASELAAEHYGLAVLKKGIEDVAQNTTRFLILRRGNGADPKRFFSARTGHDKTSIAFAMKDKPGALFRMLSPFQKNGINLTKIESRPSRTQLWRYVFFLDMEGHALDAKLRRAFKELEAECYFLRVLGSYPRTVTEGAKR